MLAIVPAYCLYYSYYLHHLHIAYSRFVMVMVLIPQVFKTNYFSMKKTKTGLAPKWRTNE
jgi:hypothetical protein